MRVFGIAGHSGMGKTTLLEYILPELKARGLTVSLIKHSHKDLDIDHPRKDRSGSVCLNKKRTVLSGFPDGRNCRVIHGRARHRSVYRASSSRAPVVNSVHTEGLILGGDSLHCLANRKS